MLNNLRKYIIFFVVLGVVLCALYAYAACNRLVVVYPKNGATIQAKSTFFIGNTNPDAVMTINGEPVKVYSNGAFVRVFSLNKGKNDIKLVSKYGEDVKIQTFSLYVPSEPPQKNSESSVFVPYDTTIVVVEKEAPLRKTPYGDRLTPVKEGMFSECVGIINNHYKVKYGNDYAYILKNFAKPAEEMVVPQRADKISFHEDKKNIYVVVPLKQPVLADISNVGNILKVKLEGVTFDFSSARENIEEIQKFDFSDNSFSIIFNSKNINGYDYYYEGNKFVLKIRKPFKNYIEGKVIVIDPGHGGKEPGAVGPTEIPEKDVNLQISKYLRDELLKAGAHVYMTREKDEYVDLYDRVDFAQKKHADILVSVHNNALSDGQNPYITHGTETYYFQPQAKILAQSVQRNLVLMNGFNDLGVKYGSLVLTRPTFPVSILVEVGFMINPDEYSALLIPANQLKYAIGIKNGIVEYFKNFS